MQIFEPATYLDVETPMGLGNIWLVKDFGLEMDCYYTVVIREGDHAGQIFDFPNSDVRVRPNYSLHRGSWRELSEKVRSRQSIRLEKSS